MVKRRSCEQFKARRGSVQVVRDRDATPKCEANAMFTAGFPLASLKNGVKRRSCEQFKARRGSVQAVRDRDATMKCEANASFYRMKLVIILRSRTASTPASLPSWIHFKSQAMLLPRIRIVCKPSSSCAASSAVLPWISFQ